MDLSAGRFDGEMAMNDIDDFILMAWHHRAAHCLFRGRAPEACGEQFVGFNLIVYADLVRRCLERPLSESVYEQDGRTREIIDAIIDGLEVDALRFIGITRARDQALLVRDLIGKLTEGGVIRGLLRIAQIAGAANSVGLSMIATELRACPYL